MAKRKKLSRALDAWMIRNNKSAEDVAYLTHVSRRTIERLLDEESSPSPLVADAITKLIELDAQPALKAGGT